MLYRIYVGPFRNDEVVVSRGIDSFSIIPQQGFWKGEPELSWVYEIFDDHGQLESKVHAIAEDMRSINNQDTVYVVQIPVTSIKSVTF